MFHGHRFEVIETTRMIVMPDDSALIAAFERLHASPQPFTLILERCRCGKLRTQKVDGHWDALSVGSPLSTDSAAGSERPAQTSAEPPSRGGYVFRTEVEGGTSMLDRVSDPGSPLGR